MSNNARALRISDADETVHFHRKNCAEFFSDILRKSTDQQGRIKSVTNSLEQTILKLEQYYPSEGITSMTREILSDIRTMQDKVFYIRLNTDRH